MMDLQVKWQLVNPDGDAAACLAYLGGELEAIRGGGAGGAL